MGASELEGVLGSRQGGGGNSKGEVTPWPERTVMGGIGLSTRRAREQESETESFHLMAAAASAMGLDIAKRGDDRE